MVKGLDLATARLPQVKIGNHEMESPRSLTMNHLLDRDRRPQYRARLLSARQHVHFHDGNARSCFKWQQNEARECPSLSLMPCGDLICHRHSILNIRSGELAYF
jgi:hypothetical protein